MSTTGPRGFDAAERLAKCIIDEANERKGRGGEPQTATLIVQAIRRAVQDVLERFPLSGISDGVRKDYGIREEE